MFAGDRRRGAQPGGDLRQQGVGEPRRVTVLLDARDPVRRGGTGRTVDWGVAAEVAAGRRIFLAGGLGPGNVGEALRTVRPYGVDVSSGVETRPGRKDAGRLRVFFEEVARA